MAESYGGPYPQPESQITAVYRTEDNDADEAQSIGYRKSHQERPRSADLQYLLHASKTPAPAEPPHYSKQHGVYEGDTAANQHSDVLSALLARANTDYRGVSGNECQIDNTANQDHAVNTGSLWIRHITCCNYTWKRHEFKFDFSTLVLHVMEIFDDLSPIPPLEIDLFLADLCLPPIAIYQYTELSNEIVNYTGSDSEQHRVAQDGRGAKSCPECGVVFTRLLTKLQHMRDTHPEMYVHKCHECNRTYNSKSGLSGHRYRHHNTNKNMKKRKLEV